MGLPSAPTSKRGYVNIFRSTYNDFSNEVSVFLYSKMRTSLGCIRIQEMLDKSANKRGKLAVHVFPKKKSRDSLSRNEVRIQWTFPNSTRYLQSIVCRLRYRLPESMM